MRTPARPLTFETNREDNEKRLKELILYVVEKCGDDPRFGATKLNKVLYFSDFFAYARHGKPITGVAYQKLKNGPAPKRLLPVRAEMIDQRELHVSQKPLVSGYTQSRFAALRQADTSIFSGDEIALVDEVIDYLRDMTAEEVSEKSHLLPWQLTDENELIPYEYVFLADVAVTESDIAKARELATARRETAAAAV